MTAPGPRTWVDGRLVEADRATVSVHDRGFRGGEGVFETLRVYGDHVFRVDAHLERALRGAARLDIDVPSDGEATAAARLRSALAATVAANREVTGGEAALRLTLTPGAVDPATPFPGDPTGAPTTVVTCHPVVEDPGRRRDGVAVVTVPWSRPLSEVKSLSCLPAIQARRRARSRGAHEALLTSPDGQILEGATSNVFALVEDRLVTPPRDAGILPGVTRRVLLEIAGRVGLGTDERTVDRGLLARADEVVLTSTVREVVPVVAVDGEPVGSGAPGPVARDLWVAYREEVDRERGSAAG